MEDIVVRLRKHAYRRTQINALVLAGQGASSTKEEAEDLEACLEEAANVIETLRSLKNE